MELSYRCKRWQPAEREQGLEKIVEVDTEVLSASWKVIWTVNDLCHLNVEFKSLFQRVLLISDLV